jgi:peptidoglycan/LPS O-acetylase OafA/YrhL
MPTETPDKYPEIPALTGMRFFAAACVMVAHGAAALLRFGEHQPFIYS